MAFCKNLAKAILAVVCTILWAVAVLLIFVAGWISREYLVYRSHLSFFSSALYPLFFLLAAGVLLFVFIAVGCVGLLKENKCLLSTFFFILLVIFLLLVGGFVVSLVYKEKIDVLLKTKLTSELNEYKSDDIKAKKIDFIQTYFVCCGVNNYSDWMNTAWYNQSNPDVKYPRSCCESGMCTYHDPDPYLHGNGCYGEVKHAISKRFVVAVSAGAGCVLLLVFGMICSCVLLCADRRNRTGIHYVGLTEEAEHP